MKQEITAFQNHATVYRSNGKTSESMPWPEALDKAKRVLQFKKIEELPQVQKSLAYTAVGMYGLMRGGKL